MDANSSACSGRPRESRRTQTRSAALDDSDNLSVGESDGDDSDNACCGRPCERRRNKTRAAALDDSDNLSFGESDGDDSDNPGRGALRMRATGSALPGKGNAAPAALGTEVAEEDSMRAMQGDKFD